MQTVYTEWINKKVSLYSTVNYLQYPVINHNGKEYEKVLFSRLQLFVTPWTAACQTSWSFTISWSLLKLVSIESVMPSNYPTTLSSVTPFSSSPWSFPASGSFPMSQCFASGGQSIGASASASVLPMNIQGWFPLGSTSLISLQSKGFSNVFSSTVWKHQFFLAQPSFWFNSHICTCPLEKP